MHAFAKLTCSYLVLVGALTQNVASIPVNQPVSFSQRIQSEASCTAVTKGISGLDKSKVIGFVDQLCKQDDNAPCTVLLGSARMVCSSQGAMGIDLEVTSQSSSIDCGKLETKFNENMNLTPGAKVSSSKFFMNGNGVSDNQSCYTLCLRDHHPICPLIQCFLNAIPAKNAPIPTKKSLFGIVGNIARVGSGSGVPTASGAKRVEAEPIPDTASATGVPEATEPKPVPGIGKLVGPGSASGLPAKDVENTGSASKISTDQKSEAKSDDSTQKLKPSELVNTKKAVPENTNAKPVSSVPAVPETKPEPNVEVVSSGNAAIPETKVDVISTTKPKQSIQDIKEDAIAKPSSDAFDGDRNQDPLDDSAEEYELANVKTPSAVDSTANKRTESQQSKKEDTYSNMPQLQYNDPLAGPDTGYFGHFIMFLAVCAIIFLLLQNKKRIIAMVIEGPKNTGGRRRTPSTSGSYRKLENNFD